MIGSLQTEFSPSKKSKFAQHTSSAQMASMGVHGISEKQFQVVVMLGNRIANIDARRETRVKDLMQSALKQLQHPITNTGNTNIIPKYNGHVVRCIDSTLDKTGLDHGSILQLSLGLAGGVGIGGIESGYQDEQLQMDSQLFSPTSSAFGDVGETLKDMSSKLLELIQRQRSKLKVQRNILEPDQDDILRNELEQQIKIGDTLANTLTTQMELEDVLGGHTRIGPQEVKVMLQVIAPKIELLFWLSKHEQQAMLIAQEAVPVQEPLPIRKGEPVLNLTGQGLNTPERLQELITTLSDGQVSGTLTQLNLR